MIYKKDKHITLGSVAFRASRVELHTVHTRAQNIIRRTSFAVLAIALLVTNLSFVTYIWQERASATTATVLPDGDVTTQWASTATPHWSKIDEDVDGTPNTGDYIGTGTSTTSPLTAAEEFTMGTVSNVLSVSNVTVELYAQSTTNINTLDNLLIQLRIGGSLQTAVTVTPSFNSWNKITASFNGSWSQADIDDMQVLITRSVLSFSSSGNADDIQIAALSADVTFIYASDLDQSSYQWFENEDVSNNKTWLQVIDGGAGREEGFKILLDKSDNIISIGSSSSYQGTLKGVVSKHNRAGVMLWQKQLPTGFVEGGADIDIYGNVYVLYRNAGPNQYTHLIKINPDGDILWTKRANDVSSGYAVMVSQSGYIYTTSAISSNYITLSKYDSEGNLVFSKSNSSAGFPYSLTEDEEGNIYIGGSLLTTYGISFVIKTSSDGILDWAKQWSQVGTNNSLVYQIKYDRGYIYASGEDATFGNVTKISVNGELQWSKNMGSGNRFFQGLAIDTSGDIYTIGQSSSLGAGSTDVVFSKFNSSGIEQWTQTIGTTIGDYGNGIAIDSDGYIITTGMTDGFGVGNQKMLLGRHNSDGTISSCSYCQTQNVTEANNSFILNTMSNAAFVGAGFTDSVTSIAYTGFKLASTQVCGDVDSFYQAMGGSNNDYGEDITYDAMGNKYVVGSTTSYGGNTNVLLSKIDSNGTIVWTKTWGGSSDDYGYALALDTSGNIYVTGETFSYDTASGDVMVIKFDNDGIEQWSKSWDQNGSDVGTDISLDASGNIYVSAINGSDRRAVIIKFNSSGVEQWSKYIEYDNRSKLKHSHVVNSTGDIYVTGDTAGTNTGSEVYLTKYNSSGVEQWTKFWGGSLPDRSTGIVLDSSENVIITGTTESYTAGLKDAFIAKFNSNGNIQWSRTWGGVNNDTGEDITIDANNNLYVIGSTDNYGAINTDTFVSKFNIEGYEQWSKLYSGNDTTYVDIPKSIKYENGNLHIVGSSAYLSAGVFDLFIGSLNSNGQSCSAMCNPIDVTDITRSASVTDQAMTETDLVVTEVDRAVTETSQTPTVRVVNSTAVVDAAQVGAPLNGVAQNTATTAPVEGVPFRLRATIDVSIYDADESSFKLQYAEKIGVCDTSFSGETYSDVSISTDIAFASTSFSDGALLVTNANDPTHTTHSNVLQEFNSSGSMKITNTIAVGEDGLWDVALVDNGAPGFTSYCFRIVYDNGSELSNYTVIPEITTQGPPLEQSGYRWFENEDSVLGKQTYAQTWGVSGTDRANAIALTSDGGYVVVGQTVSETAGNSVQSIIKYDYNGIEQWSKAWGTINVSYSHTAKDVVALSDGSIIVAGDTLSFDTASVDQSLVKFSSSGEELWSKRVTFSFQQDSSESIVSTSDGGFVVAGTTFVGGSNYDQTLVKYNSSGVEQWSKTWGNGGEERANEVIESSDGGFIVAGSSTGYGAGAQDQTLVKYNSSGVELWSKTWGGAGNESSQSVVELSDGSIITTGNSGADLTLVKYNSSGVEQWSKIISGAYGSSIIKTLDGQIAVTGSSGTYGSGITDQILVKFNESGVEQWTSTWGGASNDYGYDLVQTGDGSFVIVGYGTSYGAGGSDQTIVKFATDGTMSNCTDCESHSVTETDTPMTEGNHAVTETSWTLTETNITITETDIPSPRTMVSCGEVGSFFHSWGDTDGGTQNDIANAVAVDSLGNIYFVGETSSVGFTAGFNDQSLVKYNSSGVEQWTKTWGGSGTEIAYDLVIDGSDNIYVVGGTSSYGSGNFDQSLVKYNSSGVEQWSKTWGGTDSDVANAVTLDSSGNIYVAGQTSSPGLTTFFNDQTLVKYNSSGVEQWARTWGGDGQDYANDIVLDSSGNIYLVGTTTSTGKTAGSNDQTLIKYDASGNEQWAKTLGGTGIDEAYSIVLDTSDNIYVAGRSTSSGLTSGNDDQTLVKYNSSGVEQWTKTWGGSGQEQANDLAIDAYGNLYVVGQTNSTGLTSGAWDTTLVKYDNSGVEQWSKTWGGIGHTRNDRANGISLDNNGNIYIAGDTSSTSLTAGATLGVDQYLIKTASSDDDCSGICTLRTTSEIDRTITEVNRSASTSTRFVTEANHTLTEVDRASSETVKNETIMLSSGTPISEINSPTSLTRGDEPVRLRLVLNTKYTQKVANPGAAIYKVQVAKRIGTCDLSFTGENYTDISSSAFISFYDNPSVADGVSTGIFSNDASYRDYSISGESYEESNNFSNTSQMKSLTNYIWDFALTPNDATNGVYCIRAVNSNGSVLSGYNQIAEIQLPVGNSQKMRHGSYFDAETEGTKQSFYW